MSITQTTTPIRPFKPRPNRRQQQSLVFVEPITNHADPARESKSGKNRHIVKKWSMLNRKNAHRPNGTLEINERPARSRAEVPESPRGERVVHEELMYTEEDEDERSIEAALQKLSNPWTVLRVRNDDPFGTLPVATSHKLSGLLYTYLTHYHVEDRPWFQPDDDYGSLLVAARKQTWFPVAKESKAAYVSLLALITATSPFQSEIGTVRDGLLGEAYRLTNEELASARMLANSTVMAVVMLILIAQAMKDDKAFTSHATGLQALLETRKQCPELTWSYVMPEKYPFEPLQAATSPAFSGKGFLKLRDLGFISPAEWTMWFKDAMTINALVVHTPGDTFWWSALAQNKWLLGPPDDLGYIPTDTVFRATIRLNWHLIVWQGALLTSPIIRGMILSIRSHLTRADVEGLLTTQPFAVIWVALSTGPQALNLQDWFHKLLQVAIIAAGNPTFADAIEVMEHEYLWHSNRNLTAEKFWFQKPADIGRKACCLPDIARRPSDKAVEEDLIKAVQKLEFDEGGNYQQALETQKKRCKRCLCAWWV